MVFNIQGGAQCCALEYDWTSLLCFCEDDGSIAIVRTHSFGGRSISMLALLRPLADRFLVKGLGSLQWRLLLDSVVVSAVAITVAFLRRWCFQDL